jgi:peptidoglycan/LPS O-acetylase OafA/YrhL
MLGTFGIGLVIAWVALNQHRRAVQQLDWGPLGYLGMISYGLYIWQGLLTGNGTYRSFSFYPPEPWIGALLTLPAAMLSYHFYEQPILRLRKRFSPRRAGDAGRRIAPAGTEAIETPASGS